MKGALALMLAGLVWLVLAADAVADEGTRTSDCGYPHTTLTSDVNSSTGAHTVTVTGFLPRMARGGHVIKVRMPWDFSFTAGDTGGVVATADGEARGSYVVNTDSHEVVLTFDDSINSTQCAKYKAIIKGEFEVKEPPAKNDTQEDRTPLWWMLGIVTIVAIAAVSTIFFRKYKS